MFKRIITFLLFFSALVTFAQEQFKIKGKIQDQIELPLTDVSIIVGNKSDSIQIATSSTDEEGNFIFEIPKRDTPFYIIFDDPMEGVTTREFTKLTSDMDLGVITISPEILQLKEVLITTTDPVVIKSDTIEFNASSYKVKPNANLEALLRELPGVDIDDDGKLTVNGKEVNEILIDGEPFFGTDGKIALENIPADIIKKIQVSDYKTRNEKFSGERSRSDKSSINVTLKEDKKQGYMVKGTVGYGTDNRYESNIMANYFKGSRKISLIGSSNDIASTGLSNGAGSFGRGGIGRRGGNGITNSSSIGLNYTDKINDQLSVGGNYNFNHSYNKNDNYTRRENLLPENTYTEESNTLSKTETFGHNLGATLEWNKNLTKIYFTPSFKLNRSSSSNKSDSQSWDADGILRNESYGETKRESDTNTFDSQISWYQGFKNKSYINANADVSIGTTDSENRIQQSTFFANKPDDIRNQLNNTNNKTNSVGFDFNYNIPVTDSLKIALGSRYAYNYKENDDITWDYDELTDQFIGRNDLLSRYTETTLNTFSPYAEIQLNKKKFSGNIKAGTNIYNQDNFGFYNNENYFLNVKEVLPSLQSTIRYQAGNNSLAFNYQYNTSIASTDQLLAIENLSNPLVTYVGNPDLNPNKSHQLSLNFSNFDRKTRQGLNANLTYNYNTSSIVNYSEVDENLMTISSYTNVEGNYRLNGNLFYSKQLSKSGNKLNLNVGLNSSYARQQGYRNSRLYTAYNSTISPNIRFTWNWNDYVTISPSYNFRFTNSKYENYSIDQQSNTTHSFNLRTITTWPKNLTWTNELSYNNNSRMAAGFRRDFFLWNMQMMYSFFDNKIEAGFKIYDILNQNNSYTRTISEEFISDQRNTILTRFIMFSLTFNLNQFGGKSTGPSNEFNRPRGGNRGGRMGGF